MNEQIPINLLKEDKISDWNEWRSQNLDLHLDLTNIDLSGLSLAGANLSNSNLSGTDLTGSNLQDVDLTKALNINDIVIRYEQETDFQNACRLLFETGQKFLSFKFSDEGYYGDVKQGLKKVAFEHFDRYRENINYSKYDEFLGVYMIDLETSSYFVVINWGEAEEDEDGGWSFGYRYTTAEYNGGEISDPFLKNHYGGEYHPNTKIMEQYLIKNQISTKKLSQKGSREDVRDLTGSSFAFRNLREYDFSYANLRDTDFEEADCTGANFEGANLEGANLSGYFNKVNFRGANLINTGIQQGNNSDFTDANLTDSKGGEFHDSIFTNATIKSNLDNSYDNYYSFKNIDFSKTNLGSLGGGEILVFDNCKINNLGLIKEVGELKFKNCIISNTIIEVDDCYYLKIIDCQLNNTVLSILSCEEEIDFSGTDVTGLKFSSDSSLTSINLSGYNFVRAVFAGVNISNTDFSGCDLTGVDLTNVEGWESNFTGANLTNANLSGADLTNADFTGANLTNANLSGTDFTNANFTDANLKGIITDENTKIEITK